MSLDLDAKVGTPGKEALLIVLQAHGREVLNTLPAIIVFSGEEVHRAILETDDPALAVNRLLDELLADLR